MNGDVLSFDSLQCYCDMTWLWSDYNKTVAFETKLKYYYLLLLTFSTVVNKF